MKNLSQDGWPPGPESNSGLHIGEAGVLTTWSPCCHQVVWSSAYI